ncbi:hypothetical protein ACFCVY_17430 [Streptomyces sp. NPDC056411]|uniref:hypothetical protein n=1 Tax=Streptomyces sp. NPDC056411 TaxID=3345813 RepID=UPI0035DFAE7A
MTFGFAPPPHMSPPTSTDPAARLGRMLEPAEWASAGIPLLRSPREVVAGLYERHRPGPSTVIVAVLDAQERVTASASFTEPSAAPDGWEYRNALLTHLRRVIPHDLRLRAPVRTAVLLYCRAGEPRWTETDGAWMWGLRDACTLHGLRCGAYITLTPDRWQVLGEGRGGRRPGPSASDEQGAGRRGAGTDRPAARRTTAALPEPLRTAAAHPDSPCPTGAVTTGRATPRSAGGGAPEAHRHTAAR